MNTQNRQPQTKQQIQHFSVETVRNLLNLDNKGIAKLCTQVSLMPKKDIQGRTYFTKSDIELLRRVKNTNEKQTIQKRSLVDVVSQQKIRNKAYATSPMKKHSASQKRNVAIEKAVFLNNQELNTEFVEKQLPQIQEPQKEQTQIASAAIEKMCTSIASLEMSLLDKMSSLIESKLETKLDEKLDGMDEVVVELVRCKTENETLRYKLNELNKEIYYLKNELSSYKNIGFGLHVKKNRNSSLL